MTGFPKEGRAKKKQRSKYIKGGSKKSMNMLKAGKILGGGVERNTSCCLINKREGVRRTAFSVDNVPDRAAIFRAVCSGTSTEKKQCEQMRKG